MTTSQNPYVGPRSFRPGERLYGRDREVRDLYGLLVAERVVLLNSPSGAGKTSLIQAALVPRLRDADFHILPVVRVSLEPPRMGAETNRYVLSTLLSLEEASQTMTPVEQLASMSLSDYLDRLDAENEARDTVLIFDQFEEILTVDPLNQAAKIAFFEQLGKALRKRRRWALFSMRDDYVAALDPYTRFVPTRFNNSFRLDLLDANGAQAAVVEPARAAGADYEPEAVERLVDDLRRARVQLPDGTVETQVGPFVEPVQLQVVCYRLWEALVANQDDMLVSVADIEQIGDVDESLASYYAERVAAAVDDVGAERSVREWFDRQLITPAGLRGQVLSGSEATEGIASDTIDRLIDAYLVRAEKRRGITWFELAHDRLIDPVRRNNEAWFAANLSMLQRQADLWEQQGRSEGLLLQDEQIGEANTWAAANQDRLTLVERDYLSRSIEQRDQRLREQRRNRIVRILAVVASVVGLIALVLAVFAFNTAGQLEVQRQQAEANAQTAEASRATADVLRETAEADQRASVAGSLAANASLELERSPELSLFLAREAVLVNQRAGEDPQIEAVDVVYQALAAQRTLARYLYDDALNALAFDPDGSILASVGNQGTIRLIDMDSDAERDLAVHPEGAARLAFAPDGMQLASAGFDGSVRIWDVLSGAELQSYPTEVPIASIAYNTDGTLLAAGTFGGQVYIWNLLNGTTVELTPHAIIATGVAFNQDNVLFSVGLDGILRESDPLTGAVLRERFADEPLNDVAVSPGDEFVAAAGTNSRLIHIWQGESEEAGILPGHTDLLFSVAFDASGEYLLSSAQDNSARLWSISASDVVYEFLGHTASVRDAVFQPGGRRVATVDGEGVLRIWDIDRIMPDTINAVTYSNDGDMVAVGDNLGTVSLFDAASGVTLDTVATDGSITGLAFVADGSRLVVGNDRGQVTSWVIDDGFLGEPEVLWETETPISTVRFNADGTRLLALSRGGVDIAAGELRLWQVGTSFTLLDTYTDSNGDFYYGADFIPGETELMFAADSGIARWAPGTTEIEWLIEDVRPFGDLAIDGSGSYLAAVVQGDLLVVWSLADLEEIDAFSGSVLAFEFDQQNSGQLVAAGKDRRLRVYDLASGDTLLQIGESSGSRGVALSPDGTMIVTGGLDGQVRFYPRDFAQVMERAAAKIIRGPSADECERLYLDFLTECSE
jgi:WD40 repeat protein/Pyruvate/2-oxoacid:ferredoxin oxidoreductase gamma subunit